MGPQYLSEMCQPISSVAGRRQLRSALRGHRCRTSLQTNDCWQSINQSSRRAFSFAGPSEWTIFPRTSKTKRLPWTRLSVILNAFCSIRTDSASSTLEISRNDSALYKCSLIIIMIIIIIPLPSKLQARAY